MLTPEIMEKLPTIVAESFSMKEVLECLHSLDNHYNPNSGHFRRCVTAFIKDRNIDVSHFSGQGWRKQTNRVVRGNLKYTPDEVFTANSPVIQKVLRTYVEAYRPIPYRCCVCGNEGEWQGQPLKLQIDHINGNNRDNRPENLRYICPNCHSQTDTYCGRNKRNKIRKERLAKVSLLIDNNRRKICTSAE